MEDGSRRLYVSPRAVNMVDGLPLAPSAGAGTIDIGLVQRLSVSFEQNSMVSKIIAMLL